LALGGFAVKLQEGAYNKSRAFAETVLAHPSDDDLAARLAQVNDDVTPLQECSEWLIAQMHEGRDPDALLAELIALGWTDDDAQPLVEDARRKIRNGRGVLSARAAGAASVSRSVPTVGTGGGLLAMAFFGAANIVSSGIAAETEEVRYRLSHGLCHQCGHDVSHSADRCPNCDTPIIRRNV
jgi:hypothetical protein